MCGILALLIQNELQQNSSDCFSYRNMWNSLYTLKGRGPDNMQLKRVSKQLILGFQRLRIMDQTIQGDQPLQRGNISVIANAEIYNFKLLQEKYGFILESESDCEIFLHLYEKYGNLDFINELDGVFAFILHDNSSGITYAGRDPIGVRPIFIGQDEHGNYGFASEAKALINLCDPKTITPFKAGHFWNSESCTYTRYSNPTYNLDDCNLEEFDEESALKTTAELLYKSVCKRMMSDRPVGTFLSGGLDSSIVAAFIKKYQKDQGYEQQNLNTFSVGLEGSVDLVYSEIVAKHIGSTHHHVELEVQDCLNALEDVVYATETFDVTTIRASTPMYLLSKYIRNNSKDVVIYSGEGADEVTQGYLYFKKQPTTKDGALESQRLVEQLYEFDVLRVDRTTASHGLEVREPFLDKAFMKHYQNLPANIKCPRNGIEKYHLRKAIEQTYPGLLPKEILWRQKEAFSDGISGFKKKSWVDELKDYANSIISDDKFETERNYYEPVPMFKDALYLRRLYNKYYGNIKPQLISKYWVPNWSGENPDSSARKLDIFDQQQEDQKLMRDFEKNDFIKSKIDINQDTYNTKTHN